jgi:hypothetical protein
MAGSPPARQQNPAKIWIFATAPIDDGFEVSYYPSTLVYHNHGRKTKEQEKALKTRHQNRPRSILRQAHHIWRLWRSGILSYAYWEYCNALAEWLSVPSPASVVYLRKCENYFNYTRGALSFLYARRAAKDPEVI